MLLYHQKAWTCRQNVGMAPYNHQATPRPGPYYGNVDGSLFLFIKSIEFEGTIFYNVSYATARQNSFNWKNIPLEAPPSKSVFLFPTDNWIWAHWVGPSSSKLKSLLIGISRRVPSSHRTWIDHSVSHRAKKPNMQEVLFVAMRQGGHAIEATRTYENWIYKEKSWLREFCASTRRSNSNMNEACNVKCSWKISL